MSQDIAPPALGAQFGIGKVLGTSLAILGRNFIPFAIIATVVQLPTLLTQLYLDPNLNANSATVVVPDAGATFTYVAILVLVSAIANGFTTATLVYGSFQDLRGQKIGLGECFSRAIGVLPMIAIGAVCYGLLVGLGTMLLVIPGIIIAVVYWLYVPAIVVEKKGLGAAFTRSGELTKGKRWSIFAILLLVGLVSIGIELLVGFGAVMLGAMASVNMIVIVSYALNAIIGAFFSVSNAVTYYYLRADKEGVDIEDIARLFD
ncbi:MAG: hypothetical protein IPK59_21965 [Rhodospirillaceae bacterium]|nr:hypothetical protein [Rhodospirillaceae bacterium]